MDPRTLPTAVGAGLTTVVIGVAVVAVGLPLALGASGVAGGILSGVGGLLGLAVGVAVGSLVAWYTVDGFEEWIAATQRVVSGYAAFGLVFSAVFLLSFVVPSSLQTYFSLEIAIAAGLVVAAVAHGIEYTRAVP